MSPISTLISIFIDPAKAMQAVRERSMIWLPLLLMTLGTAAMMAWYYQMVDFPWLQDQILAASGQTDPKALETARSFMSRGVMSGIAIFGVLIGFPVFLLLGSVYYLLAAKVIGNDLGFGKWFAFSTWTAVPTLLGIPLMAVQILMASNGQLAPDALNPLTLNMLVFHLPTSDPWSGLLNAINIPSLWAIVVSIIGYKVWTAKSTLTSTFVVLLPQVVIYGGWAIIAMLRSGA
jgi:hypothetical protein